MGTNYYAILPFSSKEKSEFEALLNKLQNAFKNASSYNICEINNMVKIISFKLKNLTNAKKIHLGKRNNKSVFLWNTNDLKYYKPSLESIKKWVLKNKAIIIDEHNNEFNWEQFINDEIGNNLYINTLDEIHTNDKIDEIEKFCNFTKVYKELFEYAKDGEFAFSKYDDFISKDNLRFSFYTNFN